MERKEWIQLADELEPAWFVHGTAQRESGVGDVGVVPEDGLE